jgi:hypothetical protein
MANAPPAPGQEKQKGQFERTIRPGIESCAGSVACRVAVEPAEQMLSLSGMAGRLDQHRQQVRGCRHHGQPRERFGPLAQGVAMLL